ncbi:CARDB domain-containing protein [Geomonas azotofigens]|uniref:CARDB domain-containing protein n=1 Tax=Geomonas azotofigens TaxID=2843196 RepID=UPI001C11F97E|nr:CARDB domain-containing protein [Geomonas azotofigens]MBU5611323.1 S8 family serine peptidase [Geomonas azotofigens]
MKMNRCLLLLLSLLMLLLLPCGVQAAPGSPGESHAGINPAPKQRDDAIIVKFKQGVTAHAKEKLHQRHGTAAGKDFPRLNMQQVKVKKGMTVEETLAAIKADPDVEYAEPDYAVEASAVPNDEYWRSGHLWGLDRINAPAAWDITTGSSETVVAVIDTGIDYNHPDLADNVWTNPGIDTGYVGDVHGIDTYNHDSDPFDDNYHGTHIAGTIGALGNNNVGVVGLNWNVKLLACKCLGTTTPSSPPVLMPLATTDTATGYISSAIECLNYVKTLKDKGVNVVATNNSWGTRTYSQALYDAIAAQPDILFVGAAGNYGADNDKSPFYPASYPLTNVIAVAASGQNPNSPFEETRPSWTNYSRNTIHIAAPGDNILSTVPYFSNYNIGYQSGYGMQSGTSMAAPHVTGLAALLRSTGKDWKQTRNLILSGGDAVPALADVSITGRRLNAYNSLACTDRPLFAPLYQSRTLTAGVPVTLSVLSINCGSAVGPVIATLPGGATIELLDNGVAPDQTAGDGIFTATWTPNTDSGTVNFSYPGGSMSVGYPQVSLLDATSVDLPASYIGHIVSAKLPLRFAMRLGAVGGLPPYTWSIASGTLPAGLSMNPATGEISGIPTETGNPQITVRVTDSAGYYDTATWQIMLTKDEMSAWPFVYSNPPAGADGNSSPVFADVNGDGKQELIVSMWNSLLVLKSDNTVYARYDFPAGTTISTPAVSDLFRNGSNKIIVSVNTPGQPGGIVVFTGGLQTVSNSTTGISGSCGAPVIADLNSDGNKTITVECSPDSPADPNFGKSILATVTAQGTMLPGWPVLNGPAVGSRATSEQMPVVGDLLGDGRKEVVSITSDGVLHAYAKEGNEVKQWQAATNLGDWNNAKTRIWTPVLADVNGDNALEVLVKQNYFADATTQAHRISVFDKNGTQLPGWPLQFPVPVAEGGIIAADLTKDAIPEIITNISSTPSSYQWRAFKGDGSVHPGWTLFNESQAVQKKALPIVGGYGGNTLPDIFFASSDTDAYLQGYNASGVTLASYPERVALNTYAASSPAMGDFDGDGKLELALKTADGNVHVWKSGQYLSPFSHQWTVFAHDLEHTGTLPVLDPSQLPGSDLVVSAVSGSVAAGKLSYSVTVTNSGTITAGSSSTDIYLSTDNVISSSDVRMIRLATPSIAAGASVTLVSSIALPTSLANGSYFVGAIADATGIVVERDESNNAATGDQFTVHNDLTVSDLSGTLSAGVLTYTVTLNNTGNGNANAPVALYFSDDASAATTDRLITTLSATAIPGGTSKTLTGMASIPGTMPAGTFYLAALADPANIVAEDSETNNGTSAEQFTVGNDLQITAVSGSISGGKLDYSITVLNTGNIAAAASSTGLYLSRDTFAAPGDYQVGKISTPVLAPGAQVVLTGSVTLSASAPTGSFNLTARADVAEQLTETDEGNNSALGNPVVLNNDLTVTAVSATLSGGVLTYSVTVENNGNGNPNVPASLYFSTDPTVTTADYLVTALYTSVVPGGSSKTFNGSVTVPGTIPSGTFYLGALADPANIVSEDNENNNGATGPQFAIGSDLRVTAVSGAIAGGMLTYSVTVKNDGNITSGGSSTGIYLSTDATATTADFLVTKVATAQIPAGADLTLTGSVPLAAPTPIGTFYLAAVADMAGIVAEANEDNNGAVGNQVQVKNDLTVSSVSGNLSAGVLNYSVTVSNSGNGNPNVPVALYFSADNSVTTSDYLITQIPGSPLPGGSSKTISGTVTIPSTVPAGTFYLAALADPNGIVAEDAKSNNGSTGTQFTIGSDLRVTAVSGSVSGGMLTYSVTVRNDGNTTSGVSNTGIYLSTDAIASTSDYLVLKASTPPLQPGTEVVLTGSFSLLAAAPSGSYQLAAITDVAGVVTESDETNNGAIGNAVTVNNDLTVSAVSGTIVNGVLTYSVTVNNSGNANPTVPVNLYFSADTSVTTTDYLVTQIPGFPLPGGTSKTITGTVTIPSTVPAGTFYLGALADPNNIVTEDDNGNNGAVGAQVTIGSDLKVTAVSGSIAGGMLTYSVTVRNDGSITSGVSNTGIYLSTDAIASTSDYLVLKASTQPLAPGTEVVLTGSYQLVATTPSGNYQLASIADVAGVITESDETNNGAVGNAVTVNNDLTVSAVSGTIVNGVLTYSVTVNNSGNANPTVPVNLYFSADTSVTTTDYLVTQIPGFPLPGGTSKTITGTVTIPSTVPAGTFSLGALADPNNIVTEDDNANNGAVGAQVTIGSDLRVTAVTGSIAGGMLTYSVTVRNDGSITSGVSNTGIYLSTDAVAATTDYLVLKVSTQPLQAGGEVVLTGSYLLLATTPSGSYQLAAIADVAGVVTESDETNNGAVGNAVTVNNDLTVSAVSGTIVNGVLTYSVTVNNSGNANPTVPVTLYFSADTSVTTSDYLVTQIPGFPLPGGTSKTITGTVTIPSTVPAGTFYLGALADPNNIVTEDDNANNGAVGAQFAMGSDLQVSAVTGSISGGVLTYSLTVKNAGSTAAAYSNTGLYLSTDTTASSADYLVVKVATPPLAAGAATVLTGSVVLTSSTPVGSFYLAALADVMGVVTESDESNNGTIGSPVQVRNDLTVTAVSGTLANGVLSYSVTVNNSGNGNPNVPVTLYFSADATASTSDYVITIATPSSVAGGTSKTFTGTVNVPSSIPAGTYYLAALADPANVVAEDNDANNGAVGAPFGVGSDLQVTAVTGSVSAGKLTYSVTVKNIGSTYSGLSYTGVYLSRLTFTGTGEYLVTKVSTAQLAPGAQTVLTGTVTIPTTVPTGTYMVSGIADTNAQLAESDEGNNALFGNQVVR